MTRELKQRHSATASGLANYIGLGFNTPEKQLQIDLGNELAFVNDSIEDAFLRGNTFENPVMDYWEERLDIKIRERNSEKYTLFDGALRVMPDGKTMYNGIPTTVEAKFTTGANSFMDNKAYEIQARAGMIAQNTQQAILIGMHNGKGYMKLFKRDKRVDTLIEDLSVGVMGVLSGLMELDELPTGLAEWFTPVKEDVEVTEFADDDKDVLERLIELKEEIKAITTEEKELKAYITGTYQETERSFDDGYKISVKNQYRKGSLDTDALQTDYPEIDLSKYQKEGSWSQRINTSYKQPKE